MKNNRNTLGKRIAALMLSGMIAIGIQPATNVVVDAAETQSEEQENVTTSESGQTEVMTAEEIIELAKLPSRQELLAKLAGCLLANISKLAVALDQVKAQKEA